MGATTETLDTKNAQPTELRVVRALGILGFVSAAAVLIWGTLLGGVNVGSMQSLISTIPFNDKGAHFLIYGALAFALTLIIQKPPIAVKGAILLTGVGVAEEFRQRFVSGRTFEVADMVANGLGAAVGLVVALAILAVVRRAATTHRNVRLIEGRSTPKLDLI